MRNGDFSELLALGSQYQIYDPATTRPHPTQAGRFIRDPFPGQHHSARTASARSRRTSSTTTRCRTRRARPTARNNYTNPTAVAFETYYTATTRVDHNFSDGTASTAVSAGTSGKRRRTTASTTSSTGIFLNRKNRVFALDDAYTVQEQPAAERARRLHAAAVPGAAAQPGLRSVVARLRQLAGVAGAGRRCATFPNVTFDGYQAFSPWESGDGFFTTDVYNVTGNADLAGRQPQHEVRHRVSPLRRELEPFPDRRVADDRVRQHLDARSARQLVGARRAARTSRRSCSACRPAAR